MMGANALIFLAAGVAVAAGAGGIATTVTAAPAPFMVTSSSFSDGGMLTKKQAADDPMRMCGGENVSPALAWSNAPAKTKSFVVFLLDPDGLLGQGVSHWLGYNILGLLLRALPKARSPRAPRISSAAKARATTRSISVRARRWAMHRTHMFHGGRGRT